MNGEKAFHARIVVLKIYDGYGRWQIFELYCEEVLAKNTKWAYTQGLID